MYAKTFNHRTNGSLSGSGPQSVGGPPQARNSTLPAAPDQVDPVARLKHRQLKGGSKYCPPPAVPSECMDQRLADRLRGRFIEKVNQDKPNQLIAAFHLEKGIVQSYHVFQSRAGGGDSSTANSDSPTTDTLFELTERRRRLLHRYYQRGRQFVLLYRSYDGCEHYLPVGLHFSSSSTSSGAGGGGGSSRGTGGSGSGSSRSKAAKKESAGSYSGSSSSASGPSGVSSDFSSFTAEFYGGGNGGGSGGENSYSGADREQHCVGEGGKQRKSNGKNPGGAWAWLLRWDKKTTSGRNASSSVAVVAT